jgi:integrase
LKELADRCLGAIQVRPSTLADYRRRVDRVIVPVLGHRTAAELRRADVRAFLEPIAKRTPVQANRTLALLRRSCSWALEQDGLEASPCVGIRPPGGRETPSERVLSADELRALLQALDVIDTGLPALGAATRPLLLTGLREAAALGLRRGDLVDADGAEPRLVVPPERLGTKARRGRGRAHVVPLSAPALAVVKRRLEAVPTGHLFPQKPTPAPTLRDRPMGWNFPMTQVLRYQLGLAWAEQHALDLPRDDKGEIDEEKVRKLIPPWTVHKLRHTIATHMREQLRVSRDVVALILGHQQRGGSQATAIYDRAELLPGNRSTNRVLKTA